MPENVLLIFNTFHYPPSKWFRPFLSLALSPTPRSLSFNLLFYLSFTYSLAFSPYVALSLSLSLFPYVSLSIHLSVYLSTHFYIFHVFAKYTHSQVTPMPPHSASYPYYNFIPSLHHFLSVYQSIYFIPSHSLSY